MKIRKMLIRIFALIIVTASCLQPVIVFAWWSDGGSGVSPDTDTTSIIKSGTCGDNVTYELRSSGNLFISGSGAMCDYPESGAPWRSFAYSNPMYAYFDDGVTYIGKNAFAYCYTLRNVSFPSTLVEIGDKAFYQAAELGSIVLPEGLTTIGYAAFVACGHPGLDGYNFNSVTLPSTIKTIGDSAFSMCGRLSNINLPDGLEYLGNSVFASCFYLTRIEMPDSVTHVGSGVFNSCSRLTSLRLSNNLEVLPKDMFSAVDPGKTSMTEITLPLRLKHIESKALNNYDLKTIYIPGNVETIASKAFGGFTGTIYFNGNAPSFDPEFFNSGMTIYYPDNNNTWDSVVKQYADNGITWIAHEVPNCDNGHDFENGMCNRCGDKQAVVQISAVSLRPSCAGLYFTGSFDFAEPTTIERYGIAVSLSNALPEADNSDPGSVYTVTQNSVLIANILSNDANDAINAATKIYARAYALTTDGTYVYGDAVVADLHTVMVSLDSERFSQLGDIERFALKNMYQQFFNTLQHWKIPNIKQYCEL